MTKPFKMFGPVFGLVHSCVLVVSSAFSIFFLFFFGRVLVHILAARRQFELNKMFGRVFGHSLDVGRQFDFF